MNINEIIDMLGYTKFSGYTVPNIVLVLILAVFAIMLIILFVIASNKQTNNVRKKTGAINKKNISKKKDSKTLERENNIKKKKELQKELRELYKLRNKKSKLPKTVQDTIPYLTDYDNGVFEISRDKNKGTQKYSICISFEDINYGTLKPEDAQNVFKRYEDLLNQLPTDSVVQLILDNRTIDVEKLKKDLTIAHRDDDYNQFRDEMNNIMYNNIIVGNNHLKKERYLVVTIEAENPIEAFSTFNRLETEIVKCFKRLNSTAKRLTTMQRFSVLHDTYRHKFVGEFNKKGEINYELLKKMRISMKDYISPDGFMFNVNNFMMGDVYGQVMFINEFPSTMSDEFVTELANCNFDIEVALTIQPLKMQEGIKTINKQILGMEANKQEQQKQALKAGYTPDMINHNLQDSLEDAYSLRDDVQHQNQKIFYTSFIVRHFAESEEKLKYNAKILQGIASKYLCQLRVLEHQQEKGLAQSLPLGQDILAIKNTLTSESTAIFIPFLSQELQQYGDAYNSDSLDNNKNKRGFYYGINQISNNLIIFNRLNLQNANGFYLGGSGSGKSFSAKREMVNVLLNTDDDVIVIDPDGEYVPFVEAFGGERIVISTTSETHINPMDLDEFYLGADDNGNMIKGDPIMGKSDFLISVIEAAIGDKDFGLSPNQKAVIDECIRMAYEPLVSNDYDPDYIPTFVQLQEAFENKVDSNTSLDLAESFKLFTTGSLSCFSHKTNVNIRKRLAVFDISDLKAQLNTIGSLIMLDAVWQRVLENRRKGKRTWVYCDEFTVLLRKESSKIFFLDVFKRIRKMGGSATGITQNITSLYRDPDAMEMLANAEFVYMLNQSPTDRVLLAEMIQLSDSQIEYVTDSDKGCGLIKAGSNIVPFKDEFPKNTKLYECMTTDPEERKVIDKNR